MSTKRTKKSTMTHVGYSIPLDLIIEILLKLPAKSVLRFRSVSKSWCSIINSKQFKDAFVSLSLSRSRVVLAFTGCDENRVFFFSSPHQNCSFLSSSSKVGEENTLSMPKLKYNVNYICNSVRGFLCCRLFRGGFVVCNPSTRQVIHLSQKNSNHYYPSTSMYLGYDPNNDQYKVLRFMRLMISGSSIEHSVRTLGGRESDDSWRTIKANVSYDYGLRTGVCIDGIVYYKCGNIQNYRKTRLSSFDVGSEQIHLIATPEDFSKGEITNYLGKLAVYFYGDSGFNLWVLDDVKNQVWSKKIYVFPSSSADSMLRCSRFVGISAAGEIFYVPRWLQDPFVVFVYDAEKRMERRVKLKGLPENTLQCPLYLWSYVENIIYL